MLEEDIDTTQEETDIDEQSDSTFVDSARFAITET